MSYGDYMAKAQDRKTTLISEIGRVVRSRRAERRLTQKAVATLAGVDVVRISEIEGERANPRLATVEKIAQALGITVRVEAA